MNLEQYRKKVQMRLTVMKILVGVYMVLMLTGGLLGNHPSASMLVGMGTAGGLVALKVIIQQSKALRDEKKLRQLYIQEHDERMMAIRQKAGYPVLVYLSLAVTAAALIAGFFNETVMLTLIAVAMLQLLLCLAIKFWCMRHM